MKMLRATVERRIESARNAASPAATAPPYQDAQKKWFPGNILPKSQTSHRPWRNISVAGQGELWPS
jgi:hypothetical protein